MKGREADGVVVASAAVADANVIGLAQSGYPIVIVGRAPHVARATAVSLDDCHGGEVATRHLLDVHEVRRVAHISGPLGHQSAQDKLTGYRNALMASAIAPEPALEVEGDYSDESGAYAVEELVRRGIPFEAIFAANDQMALGAREALQSIGLSVPGDVLLVGYDDIPLARYVEPALTSVQGDMAEVGSVAALRLLELIGGRLPDQPVTLLPTELVVRKSCGCGRPSAEAPGTSPRQSPTGEKQKTHDSD
jgi:DNA-binding LacI/PurR family transcriptional regulator